MLAADGLLMRPSAEINRIIGGVLALGLVAVYRGGDLVQVDIDMRGTAGVDGRQLVAPLRMPVFPQRHQHSRGQQGGEAPHEGHQKGFHVGCFRLAGP